MCIITSKKLKIGEDMELNQNIIYDELLTKLDNLHNALVDMKTDHLNADLINEIFRSVHTIKGTCDLLGMFDVVRITHEAEDLLDAVRQGKSKVNDRLVELFFDLEDYLKTSINNLSEGIFDDDYEQELANLIDGEFKKYLNQPDLLEKRNILVVDNESLNRYKIKKIINDLGHDVYMVENGEEAFKKIQEKSIDIIFCDVDINCHKCKEFLYQVKSDILYDHIHIVILIDILNKDMLQLGKKLRAKAWLSKKIEPEQVKKIIDKLVH